MVWQPPDLEILEDRRVYNGTFLSVLKRKIRVGREIIERELIQRRDGVAIVAVDIDHNVLLYQRI